MATSDSTGTYEMLWDCGFCGSKKLLGLTHRHCPACGAAQDPSARYFPPAGEEIAVEDHAFTGADKVCAACTSPNAAKAAHCGNCGFALEGADEVQRQADQVEADGGDFVGLFAEVGTQPPPAKKGGAKGKIIGGIVGLVVAVVAAALLWKKDVQVEVAGHAWNRTIGIERYQSDEDTSWCDSMPRDAYRVSRSREVRSHNKVPDGEDCKTRRKDNGDGSFSTVRDCKTRYRDEPVHDDKCRFLVDRWTEVRQAKESAASKDPAPHWPAVELTRPGTCKGCEREGKRKERYTVHFASTADAEKYECAFPEARWTSIEAGERWQGKAGALTKRLDCDELVPAP